MLLIFPIKKAVIIAIIINGWICIYSTIDILWFDNGSEFIKVYFKLIKSFGICIINDWL